MTFGYKLSSSFRALWTLNSLYLERVSHNNRQLELERVSPRILPSPCSHLQHQTSFGLQPSFFCGSCFLPLLSLLRLNVQAYVHPLVPWALTLALSQLHLWMELYPGLAFVPSSSLYYSQYPIPHQPHILLIPSLGLGLMPAYIWCELQLLSSYLCWLTSPSCCDSQRVTKSQAEVPAELRNHSPFKIFLSEVWKEVPTALPEPTRIHISIASSKSCSPSHSVDTLRAQWKEVLSLEAKRLTLHPQSQPLILGAIMSSNF